MLKKSIKSSTYSINSTNRRPQSLHGPSVKSSWCCGCFWCVVTVCVRRTADFINALSAFASVVNNVKVSRPSHGATESPLCLKYYVSQFCFFEDPQSVLINQNLKALITHSPWDTHTYSHTLAGWCVTWVWFQLSMLTSIKVMLCLSPSPQTVTLAPGPLTTTIHPPALFSSTQLMRKPYTIHTHAQRGGDCVTLYIA